MSFSSTPFRPPTALTIAGSDSGGAAGLQADLKTFAALGVYGLSVITVVTAQNSQEVMAVQPLKTELVAMQIDAVLSDYGAGAVKTGFIGQGNLIDTVADKLGQAGHRQIVVDPVLVDHRGNAMFGRDVTRKYIERLFPLANLITPNWHEAALLLGKSSPECVDLDWLQSAAEQLFALGPRHVLIKGGKLGADSSDLLFDGMSYTLLTSPWIDTRNTHGSGDTLSAAVCAFQALGYELLPSIRRAHKFTASAIARASGWHMGKGHGPVDQANISQANVPFDSLDKI